MIERKRSDMMFYVGKAGVMKEFFTKFLLGNNYSSRCISQLKTKKEIMAPQFFNTEYTMEMLLDVSNKRSIIASNYNIIDIDGYDRKETGRSVSKEGIVQFGLLETLGQKSTSKFSEPLTRSLFETIKRFTKLANHIRRGREPIGNNHINILMKVPM